MVLFLRRQFANVGSPMLELIIVSMLFANLTVNVDSLLFSVAVEST